MNSEFDSLVEDLKDLDKGTVEKAFCAVAMDKPADTDGLSPIQEDDLVMLVHRIRDILGDYEKKGGSLMGFRARIEEKLGYPICYIPNNTKVVVDKDDPFGMPTLSSDYFLTKSFKKSGDYDVTNGDMVADSSGKLSVKHGLVYSIKKTFVSLAVAWCTLLKYIAILPILFLSLEKRKSFYVANVMQFLREWGYDVFTDMPGAMNGVGSIDGSGSMGKFSKSILGSSNTRFRVLNHDKYSLCVCGVFNALYGTDRIVLWLWSLVGKAFKVVLLLTLIGVFSFYLIIDPMFHPEVSVYLDNFRNYWLGSYDTCRAVLEGVLRFYFNCFWMFAVGAVLFNILSKKPNAPTMFVGYDRVGRSVVSPMSIEAFVPSEGYKEHLIDDTNIVVTEYNVVVKTPHIL